VSGRDETFILGVDLDGVVADHTRRFREIYAELQGVEPERGEVRHREPWREDADHATLLARAVRLVDRKLAEVQSRLGFRCRKGDPWHLDQRARWGRGTG